MDAVKNFAKVEVSTGYDASAGTVVLTADEGAKLPAPATDGAFNLVWWNFTDYPDPTDDPNKEIVRVTARSTDTLTVTRAQEGTSASTKNTAGKTYNMMLTVTKKTIDDLVARDLFVTENLLDNGNFINNSTNGYGGTADSWTGSNSNAVQGGFPTFGTADLVGIGVAGTAIQGLWNLNEASGNAVDLSANGYNLTDTNTVQASSDGLMGIARDFELDNSEHFTIANANCANLEIAGNQTWFAWIKSESIAAAMEIMSKKDLTHTANRAFIQVTSTGAILFRLSGLTTAESLTSDVITETGKWYFVCGVYNGSALNVFVNGVKKTTAASGSHADSDSPFSIGAAYGGAGDTAGGFFDGLIQNCGVLSVGLTDAQVKKLWALTTYKGTKIRRATNDAYVYQTLNEEELIRLRGKTITLRATGYKDTASTDAQLAIYDGTTETLGNDLVAEDTWEDQYVTATIPTTATEVTVRLYAKTADGNVWYKNVALYESPQALPYQPSNKDRVRFPRLLKMDIPSFYNAYPYLFEEGKWHSCVTTIAMGGSATIASISYGVRSFMFKGNTCWYRFDASGTLGGSADNNCNITTPIYMTGNYTSLDNYGGGSVSNSGGTKIAMPLYGNNTYTINLRQEASANYPTSGTGYFSMSVSFPIT